MWADYQIEKRERYCKDVLIPAITRICNSEDITAFIAWSYAEKCWKASIDVDSKSVSLQLTQHHQELLTKEIIDELKLNHSSLLI